MFVNNLAIRYFNYCTMSKIVIDIETIGFNFDDYDQKSQEYLLRYAPTEIEKEEVKKNLALYPMTGEVIVIGMHNPETNRGYVLFQDQNSGTKKFEEKGIKYEAGSEKEILTKFWDLVKTYDQVITFNGRSFDVPFLMLRSAINKVRVSKNLMGYRFDYKQHCDLLEQLTFYGATRKFNLDFYSKAFGIKSPKEEDIEGSLVGEAYKNKEYIKIAQYCARDVVATGQLYNYWNQYLRF